MRDCKLSGLIVWNVAVAWRREIAVGFPAVSCGHESEENRDIARRNYGVRDTPQ